MQQTPHLALSNTTDAWSGYWRRRRTFFIVAISVFLIAAVAAFLWPSTYRATGTILIEQQEIPQEMVRSVITSFADERIQTIRQRVMTTKNLMELIERYNLYPDIREKKPREVLLKKMQDDTSMKMISADVIDPRSGHPMQANIAFAVSYQSHSPDLALKVANDVVSLYLNENVRSRTESSEQTSAFLGEQARREAAHIAELDQKFAAFKEQHHDALPELEQLNIEVAQRTELDLHESENRITSLDSQLVLLKAQLAQLHPNTEVYSDSGQRVFGAEDRLKDLKSKLASYKALYGPNHPDVLSTQREVDGLEKEISTEDATSDRLRQLAEAKAELARDKEKYSPTHPDVVRLQAQVDGLQKDVATEAASTQQAAEQHPDNPVYLQVKGQVDALGADRAAEVKKRDELQAKLDNYDKRMDLSPEVERQYKELARDLEAAQLKYPDVLSKETEAQVAQNLETERKGERFTLIEPPLPPEKPISPNVPMIILVGLVLAIGLGAGAVAAQESFDASVRGPNDIRGLLQVPALASIPIIVTRREVARHKRQVMYSWLGSAITMVLVIISVHLFVRPLDVVWAMLLRKLGG
jgi:polysaccharide biosynthesis transport protein